MNLFYNKELSKPPSEPVQLPRSRQREQTRPENYLPDDGLVDAVNVALLLGQPLLLTGSPGTGKTQLAYSLAYQLGLGKPLKFETKSTSTARDLFYVYDALGRFHAAQAAQLGEKSTKKSVDYITYNALGLAIILANLPEDVQDFLPVDFDKKVNRILGPGFEFIQPHRSVVLIDEIDKAPRDFPNDILNEVENRYFRIPELDNVEIDAPEDRQPILVLTSNSEKLLPEAFLRRCIYYDIPFPDQNRLNKIVEARLGTFVKPSSEFLSAALKRFYKLRQGGLRKKPSTAELLNWLIALRERYKDVDNPIATHPESVSRTLSSLVKMADDQKTARRILGLDKNNNE
jgi:MoxR-like ATPase